MNLLAGAGVGAGKGIGGLIGLSKGGLVMSPQVAAIAEGGPEVVIPLDQLADFKPTGGHSTCNIYLDGRQIACVNAAVVIWP